MELQHLARLWRGTIIAFGQLMGFAAGRLVPVLALFSALGLRAADAPEPARLRLTFIERFRLFPELVPPPVTLTPSSTERAFHQPGDPDSLFTFGSPTPQGVLHLKAAFEVNDVVLHAIAPDLRVTPNDTRPRMAGDYRALDAQGRPYQLRLGARLVW